MEITNKFHKVDNKPKFDISGFTDDQAKAYSDIIKFIQDEYNPKDFRRALTGPAGTGKTYLVKSLIVNSGLSYSLIGLSAPTHKACRVLNESISLSNININTIQSDLGFRLNFDIEKFDINNPPFDPKGRVKIKEYKLYIVDEASMINRKLLSYLEKICYDNKIKILYIGDASQLPPVGESYSPCFKNIKLFKLNQIVRQDNDNPVKGLLDILRYDIERHTFNFLNYIKQHSSQYDENYIKGYEVCNEQQFRNKIALTFSDEQLTKNVDFCKVIAFTNNVVSGWNKFIRNSIIKDADKCVITNNDLMISYTTLVDDFNSCIIKNSEEYVIKDIVNYTHPQYKLKGYYIIFTAIHGGHVTTPLFILDHTDRETITRYVSICRNMINDAKTASIKLRPSLWKAYYEFKESCILLTNIVNNNTGNTEFSRDMDYGFALTSHRSQGSTFDTVFVDVKDIVYDKHGVPYTNIDFMNRRLYVACSRCKSKLYLNF